MKRLIIILLLAFTASLFSLPFSQRAIDATDVIIITDANGYEHKVYWSAVEDYINDTCTDNVGTAGTGVTAVEYGDGNWHKTVLTVSTTTDSIAAADTTAMGNLVYTLPAGACIIKSAYMSMALTATDTLITDDTPDVGLGTVIASGSTDTLDGTATFENILTGQTAADCNGTATVKTIADQILVIETGDAHTIHFNYADIWAGNDSETTVTGTIVIEWVFIN